MNNPDQPIPEENSIQNQPESMFELLERLNKDLDNLRVELPTILIDEFDPCEMCGS